LLHRMEGQFAPPAAGTPKMDEVKIRSHFGSRSHSPMNPGSSGLGRMGACLSAAILADVLLEVWSSEVARRSLFSLSMGRSPAAESRRQRINAERAAAHAARARQELGPDEAGHSLAAQIRPCPPGTHDAGDFATITRTLLAAAASATVGDCATTTVPCWLRWLWPLLLAQMARDTTQMKRVRLSRPLVFFAVTTIAYVTLMPLITTQCHPQ
jgi:hypothetical protein